MVVFAASKGRQLSLEPDRARSVQLVKMDAALGENLGDANHGLFTAAVIASLASQQADRDGDGAIELSELIDDVTVRVARASEGQQTPWVARRELFGDFRVAAPR